MLNLDPSVKRETGYIAAWTGILSLVLEAVFLVIRQWDASVLLGNLGGAAAAVGNFFVLARTVSQAVEQGVCRAPDADCRGDLRAADRPSENQSVCHADSAAVPPGRDSVLAAGGTEKESGDSGDGRE